MVRAEALMEVVQSMKTEGIEAEETWKPLVRKLNPKEIDILIHALEVSIELGKGNRGYEGHGEAMQTA